MTFLLTPLLSGCFTGIENTAKIKISKSEQKRMRPTDEQTLLDSVSPLPLSAWEYGKKFFAADNRTALVFDQSGVSDLDRETMRGRILSYQGTDSATAPDGSSRIVAIFSDGSNTYRLNTGKTQDKAPSEVMSDQLPMLIDMDMVGMTSRILSGKTVWSRSSLYYDEDGNKVDAEKYVPFTVSAVMPGDMVFPLRLKLTDNSGKVLFMMMNFGDRPTESRSFDQLFSLSDPKKDYPDISDDIWQLIRKGYVKAGMTKEECKLSLGNPSEVTSGHDYSRTIDIWHYSEGIYLRFEDGRLSAFRR